MTVKKKGPIRLDQITPEEKMKYEVAEELGLLDKVLAEGCKSLSSKESDGLEGAGDRTQLPGSSKALWKRGKSNKSITNVN
ncbi:MAG: spore protein [Lachnospiraceae bacterium]